MARRAPRKTDAKPAPRKRIRLPPTFGSIKETSTNPVETLQPVRAQGAVARLHDKLGQCHSIITMMSGVADRLCGVQPVCGMSDAVPDGEIQAVAEITDALYDRLVGLNARFGELSPPD